jgi:hypothetical protein
MPSGLALRRHVSAALLLFLNAAVATADYRDDRLPPATRADDHLARMTLPEKVGQLLQTSAHRDNDAELERQIREGEVGSFLNIAFNWIEVSESGVYQENPNRTLVDGARCLNRLQRIAVGESRLGIPVLFAHDIITVSAPCSLSLWPWPARGNPNACAKRRHPRHRAPVHRPPGAAGRMGIRRHRRQ